MNLVLIAYYLILMDLSRAASASNVFFKGYKHNNVDGQVSKQKEVLRRNSRNPLSALSWKLTRLVLPILHQKDNCKPENNCANLAVLWWKAIVGSKFGSAQFDGNAAFDFLPDISRGIVSFPFCYFYPPLLHQHIAIRSAFLDDAIGCEMSKYGLTNQTVNVVTLGAGFDARSIRYMNKIYPMHWRQEAKDVAAQSNFFEFDLPPVMQQKKCIIQRFLRRRGPSYRVPALFEIDLNDGKSLRRELRRLFQSSSDQSRSSLSSPSSTSTIFVFEAVLMYLKPGNVATVLKTCLKEAQYGGHQLSVCFADRFPYTIDSDSDPDSERMQVEHYLRQCGLHLTRYEYKSGRVRHMGVAHTLKE